MTRDQYHSYHQYHWTAITNISRIVFASFIPPRPLALAATEDGMTNSLAIFPFGVQVFGQACHD